MCVVWLCARVDVCVWVGVCMNIVCVCVVVCVRQCLICAGGCASGSERLCVYVCFV